jgi:hypothetical protein
VGAVVTLAVLAVRHAPPRDPGAGDIVRVGVAEGASIPEYEQRSRAELARLSGTPGDMYADVYALVTFRTYLSPDRLAPALAGAPLLRVYARVPLPGVQTQIVRIAAYRAPEDVTGGMDEVAERKEKEATDYARLLGGLGTDGLGTDGLGTDGDEGLRDVYTSGQRVATAEAAAYRGHCSCVYAAVVRATPAALDVVAQRDDVRMVDPAPEARRLDRTVFLPPLPEQRWQAGPPDDSTQATASPTAPPR